MKNNPFLLAWMCATVWSLYTPFVRLSGLKPNTSMLILNSITALAFIVWFIVQKDTLESNLMVRKGFYLIFLAGILNAIGMIGYGYILYSGQKGDVSTYSPMISGLMPMMTCIFSALILKEPLTAQKIGGIAVIIVGIYILNKK